MIGTLIKTILQVLLSALARSIGLKTVGPMPMAPGLLSRRDILVYLIDQ
jgi:hypothetical protein